MILQKYVIDDNQMGDLHTNQKLIVMDIAVEYQLKHFANTYMPFYISICADTFMKKQNVMLQIVSVNK